MQHRGIHQIFEELREQLLRYLRAHGANDAAEDLLQDLWLGIAVTASELILDPPSYLFRAATNLMIDHRRSKAQAQLRDRQWSILNDRDETSATNNLNPEREIGGRQTLALVERELEKLPTRANFIFRAHRIEGRTQREIAFALGVSIGTVEGDLRMAYRMLDDLRRKLEKELSE
jgi:RNA polymerase sigma factor (sigma-70 family)